MRRTSASRSVFYATTLLLAGGLLAGCQTTSTVLAPEPVLAKITEQNQDLRTLPAGRERITVAVYDFPDLTGQYKERDNVQTLSRAVTQGGATMLIKALQDAGERRWFTVLDRARLDDLLKERQIITEMRRIYRNEEKISAKALPPLDHAGIILQGGITGYDTNTLTGGAGARYLGIGADAKWQQDTVTVTLRAVSTNSGEVLSSVTVHKPIASLALQGGAFRYIQLDRILEAEAGISQNEPKQIAVQKAIEKAVMALIIEGAELGIWHFADPAAGSEVIAEYRKEKYGSKITLEAQMVPPPETPQPAERVRTTPVAPRVAANTPRPRAPAPAPAPKAPTPPPPPAEGETVGSISPDSGASDLPPRSIPGEVVGSNPQTDQVAWVVPTDRAD